MKMVDKGLPLVLALLAAGCSSPPTRFYVLSPLAESGRSVNAHEIAIGVGPVELPDYLDRPQIVTRSGQNRLELAEFDNWAEPLQDNVSQVLAENLAALLPSKRVALYPWKRATLVDYQLAAKIIRFDRSEGGEAVLHVRWSILAGDGSLLFDRESRYREQPAGSGIEATVAAMNKILGQFSRDAAEAVAGQAKEK